MLSTPESIVKTGGKQQLAQPEAEACCWQTAASTGPSEVRHRVIVCLGDHYGVLLL
jgi:hypothetical protein